MKLFTQVDHEYPVFEVRNIAGRSLVTNMAAMRNFKVIACPTNLTRRVENLLERNKIFTK